MDKINYMEQLRKNWFIIVAIASLIIAWTNIQNNISALQKENSDSKIELAALKVQVETTKNQYSADYSILSGDIREIKTSLVFIQQKIK